MTYFTRNYRPYFLIITSLTFGYLFSKKFILPKFSAHSNSINDSINNDNNNKRSSSDSTKFKFLKSESEWKSLLTPEEYHVLREKGTETAFEGEYWNFKEKGTYHCRACHQILFNSSTKYTSGTGWPSFNKLLDDNAAIEKNDYGFLIRRTEVLCSGCGSHLGHVFPDGPQPTGLRYCMNSLALKFKKDV